VNNSEAVKWFRKAAESECPYGLTNLALHYTRGWGVDVDHTLAGLWSDRAITNFAVGLHKLDAVDPSLRINKENLLKAPWFLPLHPKCDILVPQAFACKRNVYRYFTAEGGEPGRLKQAKELGACITKARVEQLQQQRGASGSRAAAVASPSPFEQHWSSTGEALDMSALVSPPPQPPQLTPASIATDLATSQLVRLADQVEAQKKVERETQAGVTEAKMQEYRRRASKRDSDAQYQIALAYKFGE
jgi:TPR repeat protein